MYIYYGMLIIATFLFASQFLFQQQFQRRCGTAWSATVTFQIYMNAAAALIMLLINGFRLECTPFSFFMALVSGICGIIYTYASMKAFAIVNLAVYSMFAMLGGMLLPALYGILFENEGFTTFKALCIGLISLALVINIIGEKEILKGWPYYLLVFFLNGMSGVIAAIHQSNADINVDSGSFSVLTRLIPFVLCLLIQLLTEKKIVFLQKNAVPYTIGYAAFCGIGNLLLLIALKYLPASVQYPIVTGGTMVFSTLISGIRKEKLSLRNLIATGVALVSTVVIAL